MRQHLSLDDKTIPLSEVPKYLPKRRGTKVHYSTVYRWATKGVRGRMLSSELIGGVRYTSLESLREFFAGIAASKADQEQAEELRYVLYGTQSSED